MVYSTWICIQPDSYAAAGLPLQGRILRPRSLMAFEQAARHNSSFKSSTNACVGLGMVPLPDTAIDFSDLRSQSSRMNEQVSHVTKSFL